MKIVIPGGTGQVGVLLARAFRARGHEVVVLGRSGGSGVVQWDGVTVGDWAESMDGADAVINLAGRSVNCRYTKRNMKQMMDSRVLSTRAVGQAIEAAAKPPPVWLQMSTATIYAHRFDAPNDEATGIIGGDEVGVPSYWGYSVDIARAWEATLAEAHTPHTRRVALRTAMVMSPDAGGIFDVLVKLVRLRLGGTIAGGRQYVSWIHEHDLVNSIEMLLRRGDVEGPINLASPNPLPQREFMAALRRACGVGIGLPATAWMARIGAFFMGTDRELVLKSRRVIPGRLLELGFEFEQPTWPEAAEELAMRSDRVSKRRASE